MNVVSGVVAIAIVTSVLSIGATGASAAMCPYRCTDPMGEPTACLYNARAVLRTWVGGGVNGDVRLVYSPEPYCGRAWGLTGGRVWAGTFFTRTTRDFTYAHFNQDTLGLGLGGGSRWTMDVNDHFMWAFTCAYDGRYWICTGMY